MHLNPGVYTITGDFSVSGGATVTGTGVTLYFCSAAFYSIATTNSRVTLSATGGPGSPFVFFFDRPSKTLNRLLIYEYYGYPKDFIFQYQKAVENVTKADVLRVAQKYLKPQDLTVVAVGNPNEFGTPLTELGLKVQPIDLTIPERKGTFRSFEARHCIRRRNRRRASMEGGGRRIDRGRT